MGNETKRRNRLWEHEAAGLQVTLCLCEKCGEAYEADREHVCKKVNSYPADISGGDEECTG